MQEIRITKGAYDVTIYASKIVEKLKNRMFSFTPGKASKNWIDGRNDTIIVNLLRVTQELNINIGYICAVGSKSAQQVKNDLKAIFEGGFATGPAKFIYDGVEYEGFIEDLTISEYARDFTSSADYPSDSIRYDVQVNFLVGVPAT